MKRLISSFIVLLLCALTAMPALAGPKVAIYGIRMVPQNSQAENTSRPGWGGGIRGVIPAPSLANILALTAGFEVVNLLSESHTRRDPDTGLRVDQNTSQNYLRFMLGTEIGSHSRGFLRPYAGVNVAAVYYRIGTTLVIPNDSDPDDNFTQDLDSDGKTVFGYDLTLGLDLNFANRWSVEGGVRYVKSFGVPSQLSRAPNIGEVQVDAVEIHPDYFQIFIGVGMTIQ